MEQIEGINFEETFSLVVKLYTIRILLALATFYSWNNKQIDVVTEYGDLAIKVIFNIKIELDKGKRAKPIFFKKQYTA